MLEKDNINTADTENLIEQIAKAGSICKFLEDKDIKSLIMQEFASK